MIKWVDGNEREYSDEEMIELFKADKLLKGTVHPWDDTVVLETGVVLQWDCFDAVGRNGTDTYYCIDKAEVDEDGCVGDIYRSWYINQYDAK